jgi:hypothetical protein
VRLANVNSPLQYGDHQRAQGRAFFDKALRLVARGDRLEARRYRHPDKAKRLGSALQNLVKSTTKEAAVDGLLDW